MKDSVINRKNIDTENLLGDLDDLELGENSSTSSVVDKVEVDLKELPAQAQLKSGSGQQKNKKPKKIREIISELDPRECRRWKYHDRFDEWFSYEGCKSLIGSMKARGQELAGIVRPIENDPDGFLYEVIYAGRRHFSAEYITNETGTVFPFKAKICTNLSDVDALALMDLENRNREDISDFESCVSFRRQLGYVPGYDKIFKTANELIASYNSGHDVSSSNEDDENNNVVAKTSNNKILTKVVVSQMKTAGELNEIEELISLFQGRRTDIPWSFAYKLMLSWNKDKKTQEQLRVKANVLREKAASLSVEAILESLNSEAKKVKAEKVALYKETLKIDGKIALKASSTAKELSLKIPLVSLSNIEEDKILALVKEAIKKVSN